MVFGKGGFANGLNRSNEQRGHQLLTHFYNERDTSWGIIPKQDYFQWGDLDMNKSIVLFGVLGLFLFGLAGNSSAHSNYGYDVDAFCGTNLYQLDPEECLLCHTSGSKADPTPAKDAYISGDICYFCSAQTGCGGGSLDADGDGYEASVDCNDHNPNINPGALELCYDSVDNDCNGLEDSNRDPALSEPCYSGWIDGDNDGFDITFDCNDNNASVNPGAVEICDDTIDNDCNRLADTQDPACSSGPVDADSDGYDETVDCNDNNASVNPGAAEICNDAIDNDCNGLIDLLDPVCNAGPVDADSDSYDETVDCNDNDASINPGMAEICDDAKDNDCNGLIDLQDHVCGAVICTDDDADGYSVEGGDCGSIDCNDADPNINPGACDVKSDGIDQDCSGKDRLKGKACPGSDPEPPSVTCSDFIDSASCKDNGCRWSRKDGLCI